MEKKLILTLIILFSAIVVQAQGRRADQSSVQAGYGYMPDMIDKGDTSSFMFKAGYGQVFGDKGFLGKAEFFYSKYWVNYQKEQILPYQKYGINVQGGWSYEELSPVFLNGFAGIFGAFEQVNNGKKTDPVYNAAIPSKVKQFTYGFTGTFEVEIILVRNLNLTADYTQFYDMKSKFSKGQYAVFGGLKYYIN